MCVLCNPLSVRRCGSTQECMRTIKKCSPGFGISMQGECVLCDESAYCVGSQEFKCAKNSIAQQKGIYHNSQCICTAGYFQENGECVECRMFFICVNNAIQHCPTHMRTTKSGASWLSDCRCLPGFSVYSVVAGCEAIPIG